MSASVIVKSIMEIQMHVINLSSILSPESTILSWNIAKMIVRQFKKGISPQ